jgi:hypothetical protein
MTEKYVNLKYTFCMTFCPLWTVSSIITWFTLYYLDQHKAIYMSHYSQTKQTSINIDWLPTGRELRKWCVPWWMFLESKLTWNLCRPTCDSELRMSLILVYVCFRSIRTLPELIRPIQYSLVKSLLKTGDENMHTNMLKSKNVFRSVFIGLQVQSYAGQNAVVATWPATIQFVVTARHLHLSHDLISSVGTGVSITWHQPYLASCSHSLSWMTVGLLYHSNKSIDYTALGTFTVTPKSVGGSVREKNAKRGCNQTLLKSYVTLAVWAIRVATL